jgi:hypothetical protein
VQRSRRGNREAGRSFRAFSRLEQRSALQSGHVPLQQAHRLSGLVRRDEPSVDRGDLSLGNQLPHAWRRYARRARDLARAEHVGD